MFCEIAGLCHKTLSGVGCTPLQADHEWLSFAMFSTESTYRKFEVEQQIICWDPAHAGCLQNHCCFVHSHIA